MENQCDGCRRNLPLDENGLHHGHGGIVSGNRTISFWVGDVQACTADRYLNPEELLEYRRLMKDKYDDERQK